MLTVERFRVVDPEAHWRKYAPPGHENDFAAARDRYNGTTKKFGEKILTDVKTAVDWEYKVDKAVRTCLRMRRAREATITIQRMVKLMRVVNMNLARRSVDEIVQMVTGRCRQGDNGKWGGLRWCDGAVFKTTRPSDRAD